MILEKSQAFKSRPQLDKRTTIFYCIAEKVLLAGARGLEPLSYGFGDRHVTITPDAYWRGRKDSNLQPLS